MRKRLCHSNVARCVDRYGGKQVFGWIFLVQNKCMLDCIWHSVWKRKGRYYDLTVYPSFEFGTNGVIREEGMVLFLPKWEATGRRDDISWAIPLTKRVAKIARKLNQEAFKRHKEGVSAASYMKPRNYSLV
jgi:hypothetical protein